MFLKRDIEAQLADYAQFPVVAVLGPRQSGKTTLIQKYFKKHTYLSLENPKTRDFALSDPEGFLQEYENPHGIILDEFQYVPHILSYIQLEVDAKKRPGYFVITGSQNFLMNQSITQSLAGRVGILTLLPFSIHELAQSQVLPERCSELIFKGSYPRLYDSDQNIKTIPFYASYVQTYIERDVRQLINVGDLETFQRFLALCAGRIGQLFNLTEIGGVCGIDAKTAKRWLSVLEASYIVFLLPPYFNNFNKRITKTPKLYFYDTGLACSLLEISSPLLNAQGIFRGPLFENLIISDLCKQFYNMGRRPPLYFWRDANGRVEVDCIINMGTTLIPIEIKASETMTMHFFESLKQWNEISNTEPGDNYVVYAGDENQKRSVGRFLSWQAQAKLVSKLMG